MNLFEGNIMAFATWWANRPGEEFGRVLQDQVSFPVAEPIFPSIDVIFQTVEQLFAVCGLICAFADMPASQNVHACLLPVLVV
jgi:hypothetical protein